MLTQARQTVSSPPLPPMIFFCWNDIGAGLWYQPRKACSKRAGDKGNVKWWQQQYQDPG